MSVALQAPGPKGLRMVLVERPSASEDCSLSSKEGDGKKRGVTEQVGGKEVAEPPSPAVPPAAPAPPLMSQRRRMLNIFGLSMGWCLQISIVFIQISTSTLAARDYAGASTATLPGGIQNAAAMLTALPGTLLMNRFGRRPVMLAPALAAVVGAGLMILASQVRQMWLLVVGSIPLGVSFAQAQNFRFAAIEFAPAGFEPQALSLVVTGAMLSSVVGPEVARHTRNAMATPYMGTYIYMTGLAVLYALLVCVLEFHRTAALMEEKLAAAAAHKAKEEADRQLLLLQQGPAVAEKGPATAGVAAGAVAVAAQDGAFGRGRPRTSGLEDGEAVSAGARPAPTAMAAAAVTTESPVAACDIELAAATPSGGCSRIIGGSSSSCCRCGARHHCCCHGGISATCAAAQKATGFTAEARREEAAPPAAVGGGRLASSGAAAAAGTAASSGRLRGGPAGTAVALESRARAGDASVLPEPSPPAPSPPPVSTVSQQQHPQTQGRPVRQLLLAPEYLVPAVTGGLVHCGMAGLMSATPLAARDSGLSFDTITQVIQVHQICMFVPSLFTGHVIQLISARWTMALGALVQLGGNAVFFAGRSANVYFGGLAVVGLGWNWAYVGASALVAASYQPHEKFLAQGVMDCGVLLGTGLAVVLAGVLYAGMGWTAYVGLFMGVNGFMLALDVWLLLMLETRAASERRRGHA